ncbi:MAG: hypothetical protein ACK4G4_10830 [Thermus sp.]|uniref:hypothetical protein n=1 Tax=Thermus sp. TaxID=275 RepID=UPI0039195289
MDRLTRLYTHLPHRLEALIREVDHLEARMARERKALEALVPMPVHWRTVRCGKERCTRCPHGPYPYLRVKRDGKWRWQYLGKGWQPPEGFTRAGEFRRRLAHYHSLVRRLVELKERLRLLERELGV